MRNYEALIDWRRCPLAIRGDQPRGVDDLRRWQKEYPAHAVKPGGVIRAAPRFPQHNSASFGRLPIVGVGYLGKVPMSKVPIFASFDFAEILMLTASIVVIAAIAFVF